MPRRRRDDGWLWDFTPRRPTRRERRREARLERERKERDRRWWEAERERQQKIKERHRHEAVMVVRDYTALKPTEFERFVAELFERDGFEVTHRGGAGDQGCDLKMRKDDGNYVVQCKQYRGDRPVGPATVREFETVMRRHKARHGWIVTTSSFSPGAYQALPGGGKMTLMNRADLDELVLKVMGPRPAVAQRPFSATTVPAPLAPGGDEVLTSGVDDVARVPPRRTGPFGLTPIQSAILIVFAIFGSCILAFLACTVVDMFSGV